MSTSTIDAPPAHDEQLLNRDDIERVCELSTVRFTRVGLRRFSPDGSYPCDRPAAWIVYTADGGCGHVGHSSTLICAPCWKGISEGKHPFACGRCSVHVRILHAERL